LGVQPEKKGKALRIKEEKEGEERVVPHFA
jgi:hypothetical protein